jgi:hypothetical protein
MDRRPERILIMDLTQSIAPKSDQLNADDLISGPVTVTITEVRAGTPEQPVDVILAEYPGRAYRPSKSMRRVMVSAWGAEASTYAGHRLTLVRNPEITFGRDKVGGIEIAEMSHITKPLTVALTATRGKRKNFTVKPLPAETKPNTDPARGGIPERVATEAVQAISAGKGDEYFAYLADNNAPAHILNYVSNLLLAPVETPAAT